MKHLGWNKILITILSLVLGTLSWSAEKQCQTHPWRYVISGKWINETKEICWQENSEAKKKNISSADCLAMRCQGLDKAKVINLGKIESQYGNPRFKICHALKGMPGIIQFQKEGKWHETDICQWKQSFLEMELLIGIYKDYL